MQQEQNESVFAQIIGIQNIDKSSVPPIPPNRYWYQTDNSYQYRYQADDSYHYQVPGDPKKSIPLFGVSGGAQEFAKHLDIHIFGFPTKYLTNLDQYFQRYHCHKKDICNSAVFSPTAILQISFVEIIFRLLVDISWIENRISYHNQYFEGSSYIFSVQTSPLCNIFTRIPKCLRNRCQPSHKGMVFGWFCV